MHFLCQGEILQGSPDKPIRSVSIDSRTLKSGDLFWVIEGSKHDGNLFAPSVVKKGAVGAVVSRDFPPEAFPVNFPLIKVRKGVVALGRFAEAHRLLFPKLRVAAITGSNGKTTTKEMIARILSKHGIALSSPGNFNNEIGCPLTLLELTRKHQYLVLELAARKIGDIEYLSLLTHPHIAVLTNIASAHLETFGSLEKTFETKLEIVRGMERGGTIIYWGQDPLLSRLPTFGLGMRLVSFGLAENCDLRGVIRETSSDGSRVEVFRQDKSFGFFHLKLLGIGHILNALAAFACALEFDVPVSDIFFALNHFEPVAMRGERIPLGIRLFNSRHVLVHDAYNANPASMVDSAQGFLNAYRDWRKIIVLGMMHELGKDSIRLHHETGMSILSGLNGNTLDPQTVFVVVGSGPVQGLADALLAESQKGAKCMVYQETRLGVVPLIRKLMGAESSPCAVFFKASRAEAFEELIQDLNRIV